MKYEPIQFAVIVTLFVVVAGLSVDSAAGEVDEPVENVQHDNPSSAYQTTSIRGQVVWLAEELQQRYGIQSVPESEHRVLALKTLDGQIVPLVEDIRGRAFRRDERLRGGDVELLVRQYHGSPFVQVIQVFAIKEDGKYELDYWCEICAIAMFELKACDCCQGDIELRERKVDNRQ